MEKRIYTDNFERFIKESADDFKMIPSKRVWHSIYNDLHPSRKWPSVLMCLLLLTGVLFVGYVNDNNGNSSISKNNAGNNNQLAVVENKNKESKQSSSLNPTNTSLSLNNDVKNKTDILTTQSSNYNSDNSTSQNKLTSTKKGLIIAVNNVAKNKTSTTSENSLIGNKEDGIAINEATTNTFGKEGNETNTSLSNQDNSVEEDVANTISQQENETKLNLSQKISTQKENEKLNEKLVAQTNAQPNKPKQKNWKQNTSMEFYATPSIGYRIMNAGPQFDANSNIANSPSTTATNFDINNPIKHNTALNIETGFNVAYASSKRIKLKAGVQLNLTNYGITGDVNSHPSPTTLATINPTTQAIDYAAVSSYIANNSYAIDKVHNTTYQISIPIGAYYKVLNKERFDIFIGGSLQPTYVFGGKPNVISSDRKYYVNEMSLLRRWNMNTAAEAYINYKVGDINFLAGPQFRYQLFSTYNKNIAVTEKLYNIGFKVGVSKSF
jgi:hypothetical protein